MAKNRPRLLLLDANAVFAAMRHGAWEGLCAAYEVVLPSGVIQEAIFYSSREGKRVPIDLTSDVRAGRVIELAAPEPEIARDRARFDRSFMNRPELGESEAIALLLLREDDHMRFVTADGAALEAVAMLGIAERAICLADALRLCGLERELGREHGSQFFREHIQIGLRRFVTREGLRD